jgi:hypothetical protein
VLRRQRPIARIMSTRVRMPTTGQHYLVTEMPFHQAKKSAASVAPSASGKTTSSSLRNPNSLTAASTAAAASVAPSAASAAVAAAMADKLYAGAGVFLVEDIERRQAVVRNFLLTESDFVTHRGVLRWHISCRSLRYRRAPGHRLSATTTTRRLPTTVLHMPDASASRIFRLGHGDLHTPISKPTAPRTRRGA